jgi:hypothetical protein
MVIVNFRFSSSTSSTSYSIVPPLKVFFFI